MPPITPTTDINIGTVFVPQDLLKPFFDIKVTVSGSDVSVKSAAIRWSVEKRKNALRSASVLLDNNNGEFNSTILGGETVKIYLDYVDGTRLFFKGKIDEIYYGLNETEGWTLELHARQTPELADKTVAKRITSTAANTAIAALIDDNYSGVVTYGGVPSGLASVNVDLRHDSGVSAINKILEQIGYVFYIDNDDVIQAFSKGSITNTNSSITYGVNLLSVSSIGKNLKDLKNRVFVYGGTPTDSPDVFYLKTAEDTTSQSKYWIMDSVINDTSLDSDDSVQGRADAEIALNTLSLQGSLVASGAIVDVEPGHKMRVSVPYCTLDDDYEVDTITHNFDLSSGVTCEVSINKVAFDLAELFRHNKEASNELRAFTNARQMKNGKVFSMESGAEFASTSGVDFTKGKLVLQSGIALGTVTSLQETVPSYTSAEWKANGEQLNNMVVEVSSDGIAFVTVPAGALHTFSSASTVITVRITITNTSPFTAPVLESLGIYTK